jgi:hypothetical protein
MGAKEREQRIEPNPSAREKFPGRTDRIRLARTGPERSLSSPVGVVETLRLSPAGRWPHGRPKRRRPEMGLSAIALSGPGGLSRMARSNGAIASTTKNSGAGSDSDFETAAAAARAWGTTYDYTRFSLALQGRTPAEKLAAVRPPQQPDT